MEQAATSCSFCHQPQSKVEKLVQADDGVAICNRCVAFYYDVLRREGIDVSRRAFDRNDSGETGNWK
jgi:hypothetical protein